MRKYVSIYKESKSLNEALTKKQLDTMIQKIYKNGTAPEYLFSDDTEGTRDSDKAQEDWIRKTTGIKQFSYKRDIQTLFDAYNDFWNKSF